MTAATSPGALHVDRVLADPLRVPPGLGPVLWSIETGAREAHALLAPLAARPDAAPAVRAAAEELERFLEDENRSPLLRALRRPLRQITPDTPGGRTLLSCWNGVGARAAGAVALQAALDGIRAAVADVRERFGGELPRATRVMLAEARLDEADLARIGRADDVKPLHRRLRRVEQDLASLWGRMDAGSEGRLRRGASWAEEAAPGEILALLELRLRDRDRLRHERDRARTLRLLAGRQARALGEAGRWEQKAATSAHAFAERLGTLLLTGDVEARGGEDLALWGELLGAAADTVHDAGRAGAWAAFLPGVALPEARETGATQFVVPLDGTYALVSPRHPSAVRVTDRKVTLDRVVDCMAFLEHGDVETLPLARLDVEPLFEGLEAEPAWYATAQRAQLQVIAEVDDGWIARVHRRGALRRTRGLPWDAERGDEGRLRVLGTLSAPAPAEPREVGPASGTERVFCGVGTVPVAPPLAECAVGWLRVPAGSGWAAEAVQAEEACFRAVARRVPMTVPTWAGRGRLSARRLEGPLYVPPLGLRAADLPPLDLWLRSGAARPLLAAVARLWQRVTGAGYGLGMYHVDAFSFSIGWEEGTERPSAHAVVTDAPFAAPLGHYYRRPPREEAVYPLYAGLGCRVLAPALAWGDVALPAAEAQAFALFALDTMAVRPLPLSGIVHAEAVAEMVPDLPSSFSYPDLAARLSRVLLPGASAGGMIEWIAALAGTAAKP